MSRDRGKSRPGIPSTPNEKPKAKHMSTPANSALEAALRHHQFVAIEYDNETGAEKAIYCLDLKPLKSSKDIKKAMADFNQRRESIRKHVAQLYAQQGYEGECDPLLDLIFPPVDELLEIAGEMDPDSRGYELEFEFEPIDQPASKPAKPVKKAAAPAKPAPKAKPAPAKAKPAAKKPAPAKAKTVPSKTKPAAKAPAKPAAKAPVKPAPKAPSKKPAPAKAKPAPKKPAPKKGKK